MARSRAPAVLLALSAVASALAACGPDAEPETAGGALIPLLAARQDQVQRLQLRGPGSKVLVTLQRENGEWRLGERAGWPADSTRVAQFLLQLAQARRVEAKTASAAMYPRLGVEDVADPDGGGTELALSGRGFDQGLLIGKPHKPSGGRYVRLRGQARAWLTDADLGFDADPASWIEHRLVDVPLARVERVRIRPRNSAAFALVQREDRFRPDDAPSAAMGDSHAGDAIAAALQAFDIEDVGVDDGGQVAAQQLDFELVDGAVLQVAVWRDGQRDWVRLRPSLDAARADAWARQSGQPQVREHARANVADWARRFAGRRFLLPPALADTLMLDHAQILDGSTADTVP
ncbi:MAG: DUF4340 domain-containing protein [Arenimonas sp.]